MSETKNTQVKKHPLHTRNNRGYQVYAILTREGDLLDLCISRGHCIQQPTGDIEHPFVWDFDPIETERITAKEESLFDHMCNMADRIQAEWNKGGLK